MPAAPAPAPASTAASSSARERILAPLNDQQREAAEAVRGPVAILAGAGTGKTTTVTHRIAWQVASGTFQARELLAVTFTERAARELGQRLAALDVRGVEARTFHGAALWMLGVLWGSFREGPMPRLVPDKYDLLDGIVSRLPPPYKFRPRREFGQEIEWAKNRRVTPGDYLLELSATGHEAPTKDPAMMREVYAEYERRKTEQYRWDFEDVLAECVRLFDEHPGAGERIRARFQAVTVDEYQDVNLLQQSLLDHWTLGSGDVCVVGDDYQTIYAFTGASPDHLLGFPDRYPGAKIVRLERNYRSTAEVVELANRLVPRLGGFEKRLESALGGPGPAPVVHAATTRLEEASWVAAECRRLHAEAGIEYTDMAILYRINARSPEFEAALAREGVPFTVTGGAFLDRTGARGALRFLERQPDVPNVAEVVTMVAEQLGWRADGKVRQSDDAITLQADLQTLIDIATEEPFSGIGEFLHTVRQRFAVHPDDRGVHLLTMHRAKGLEWDAVFLPRLNDGELPFRFKGVAADEHDERRLLYVGITRARRHLALSRAAEAGGASEFLLELGLVDALATRPPARARSTSSSGTAAPLAVSEDDPRFVALRAWRSGVASEIAKPAYTVFDNKTLAAIAAASPKSTGALLEVSGVGPAKLEKYGDDVLAVLAGVPADPTT